MPYADPVKARENARKCGLAYHHRNAEARNAARKSSRSYLEKRRDPIVEAARRALRTAVEKGLLLRPEACQTCAATPRYALHGHHRDYSMPLDVVWVCRPCHDAIHRAERLAALRKAKP